jgi:hypothetical protein
MIVYSSGFATAEAAASRPLTHARIGYQTWLRDLDATAITASTENTLGPKDGPLRPDTFEFWEPTALPATWEIDLGTSRDVDYAGIAAHTLGSSGCAIKVETSVGDVAGSPLEQVWNLIASEIAPGNDAPLLFLDSSRVTRYVRLTITGGATMPRIASIYAGEVLAMQRPLYGGHTPITLSRETVLHRSLSRGGQFLGQGFRRHGLVGQASFRHLTAAWYRETFDPFVQSARRFPYFFAWRPSAFPEEVAYAWTDEDIRPSNMGIRSFMQVAWPIRAHSSE